MITIYARNVNHALYQATELLTKNHFSVREIAPRGQRTLEFDSPVTTVYQRPEERVLFHPTRKANPFFHFFEALWILSGRRDVSFLEQFNPRMREFSDNGETFHAAYGWRLRHAFGRDQILDAIDLLQKDPDTRRCVLSIWDPVEDLGTDSKDIPCNDIVMFKIRDRALNMTVCNRSNDLIWGAYGANAVQFSTLQEFIANALGVRVGTYYQVSDSLHVYLDGPGGKAWERTRGVLFDEDPYLDGRAEPYRLCWLKPKDWLGLLGSWLDNGCGKYFGHDLYIRAVAWPMFRAWQTLQAGHPCAANTWARTVAATDWRLAAIQYIGEKS